MPDGWSNIIKNRPEMFSIVQQATNLSIVFKNPMNSESKSSTVEASTQPTKSMVSTIVIRNDTHENPIVQKSHSNDVNELPPMNLPWDKPYWRILITAATSSVDIWGRNLDSIFWVCVKCENE